MQLGFDAALSRRILALASPVIVAMLSQTIINWLDNIMIGWWLPGNTSVDGQAALGVSLPFFWAIGGFLSAIAVGTQAITARREGETQSSLAGRALTNSLIIAFSAGLLVSILGYFLIPKIFPWLNPHPNVIRLGSAYLQIRMLGIFSMVLTTSYKAFFDGIGKTYVHLVAALIMNCFNAFLNWLLIRGELGFPRMEVDGAALASVISTYVGLAVMMYWSFRKKHRSTYRYYRIKNLNWKVIYEIGRLSIPSGLATVFVMTGFQFFVWVVGQLDNTHSLNAHHFLGLLPYAGGVLQHLNLNPPALATGATSIVITFFMAIFITSIAFGTATATLVGQSLGAKNPTLAERYGWESVKIGMYFMGLLSVAIIWWPELFLGIFTNKPAVIEVAKAPLRLMAAVSPLVAAGLILVQALFGAGNTRFVMVAELLLHTFCLIPVSYLLAITFEFEILGAWTSAALYVVLLSSIMAWKFYEGKWKDIQI